ncbi:SAP domain-containing ribonucleoprotein-like isoform X6 [Conger conger]|uniref:SAP domain-containing ribonucleoprotein-like isoform X6 n=1 Tax=Conger conger TaxID=82655 RepID=UPI002A59CFF7|nr:SAP domain-containing ribonucleoprotein-like isoform X6 [Conger conger]
MGNCELGYFVWQNPSLSTLPTSNVRNCYQQEGLSHEEKEEITDAYTQDDQEGLSHEENEEITQTYTQDDQEGLSHEENEESTQTYTQDDQLAELKQECAARGLDIKGNKGELIGRLQAYLEEHGDEEMNEEEVLGEETESVIGDEVQILEDLPKVVESPKQSPVKAGEASPDQDAVKVVKIPQALSVEEKMKKRAERFNLTGGDNKMAARAARFGLPVVSPTSTQGTSANSKPAVDVDTLKKRAQRFGMNVSSVSKKVEDDEKLKKRKERFGILTSAAAVGPDDAEAKKRKRAERFGNV